MSKKLGGIVCDNPQCVKFVHYANQDGIAKCYILAIGGMKKGREWTYCSKECADKSEEYRERFEKGPPQWFDEKKVRKARKFLNGLHFRGSKAINITVESGRVIEFAEMTDDEAVYYANEIAGWFNKPKQERPKDWTLIERLPN